MGNRARSCASGRCGHTALMKITRDVPQQLIVENNPVWLAILVSAFGLVFFAIGMSTLGSEPMTGLIFMLGGLGMALGFNMIFIRRTQLILDAGRGQIELRRRGWINHTVMTWELRYLERALVQTSRSGDTDTHRAALVISGGMDAGVHPITLVYASGGGARRAVEAINRWHAALDSPPASP